LKKSWQRRGDIKGMTPENRSMKNPMKNIFAKVTMEGLTPSAHDRRIRTRLTI
jgi:hypothetical protein